MDYFTDRGHKFVRKLNYDYGHQKMRELWLTNKKTKAIIRIEFKNWLFLMVLISWIHRIEVLFIL